MNEKRIEQVLEIERQAQGILDAATREADQLPSQAEQEARNLVEQARNQAHDEARQMVEKAQAQAETAAILAEAEKKNRETEKRASSNMEKAVSFVLGRVIGKA